MLRLAIVGAIALLPFSAVAAAASSPTLYPSFTTTPAKKGPAAPLYPSFNSPKVSSSPTITTFRIPGAPQTEPTAINDSGVIVGWFNISCGGVNACDESFIRSADGTITTFSAPAAGSSGQTIAKAINASGEITGTYIGSGGEGSFIRTPDGAITQFSIPASGEVASATSINGQGYIAGFFGRNQDGHEIQPVFLRHPNGYVQRIYAPFAEGTVCINASATITSSYSKHGTAFVHPLGGSTTKFHIGDQFTLPVGINAGGTIAGYYGYRPPGANGSSFRGFVRSPDGTITKYRVPDATNTWPAGMNDAGVVAGTSQGRAGNFSGFLRAADGTITRFSLPYAKGSWVSGINNNGVVFGYYNISNNPQILGGFFVTP